MVNSNLNSLKINLDDSTLTDGKDYPDSSQGTNKVLDEYSNNTRNKGRYNL
jgi:hypothetical protein